MMGTLDFDSYNLGKAFNPNNCLHFKSQLFFTQVSKCQNFRLASCKRQNSLVYKLKKWQITSNSSTNWSVLKEISMKVGWGILGGNKYLLCIPTMNSPLDYVSFRNEFNWDLDIEFLRIHIFLKLFMEQFIRKIACLFSAIFDFEYWIQYKMLCRHRHLL